MAFTKAFVTTADVMTPVRVPRDSFVQAGVQYPTGGAGTLQLQGTIDGTNYTAIGLVPAAGGAAVSSIAAAGIWSADVSVYEFVKLVETINGAVTGYLNLTTV